MSDCTLSSQTDAYSVICLFLSLYVLILPPSSAAERRPLTIEQPMERQNRQRKTKGKRIQWSVTLLHVLSLGRWESVFQPLFAYKGSSTNRTEHVHSRCPTPEVPQRVQCRRGDEVLLLWLGASNSGANSAQAEQMNTTSLMLCGLAD